MNIDDLTYGQIKQIAALFGTKAEAQAEPSFTPHIGKYCIIRTYASGVHAGVLTAQSGRQVELRTARRLWKWHAVEGISLSDVAFHGIDPAKSRICEIVPAMTILDALEIIPVTNGSEASIAYAPVASK